MNLIAAYFPTLAELSDEELASARSRLAEWYLSAGGELDIRPGSVFGDRVLANNALLLAGMEKALTRLLGDLDIDNIREGNIHNCDVAENFLRNFVKYPEDGLQARGVIRLIFSTDEERTLDRGLRFRFGGDINSVLRAALPNPGSLQILASGNLPDPRLNQYPLARVGTALWGVDIPVIGAMGATPVLAGAAAETDRPVPQLVSASALVDFFDGTPVASLPAMAELAARNMYSASPAHRGGICHHLLTNFPDLIWASPVLPGDAEMVRAAQNPLGVWDNALDLYLNSRYAPFQETQQLLFTYLPAAGDTGILVTKWEAPSVPLRVLELRIAGTTGEVGLFNPNGTTIRTLTRSKLPDRYPGVSSAYSALEDLWITIEMPLDDDSHPVISTTLDLDGNQTAVFEITFLSEPLVRPAHAHLTSPESISPLTDVLVRSGLPVFVSNLTVTYDRRKGVSPKLDTAAAEIVAHFHSAGFPSPPAEAMLADSMLFAGAVRVLDISVTASLAFSVATHLLTDTDIDPEDNPAAALTSAVPLSETTITTFASLVPDLEDPEAGTPDDLYRRAGARNVRWLIPVVSINFVENS